MISARVQPNACSAASFQSVIRPSASMLTNGSPALEMISRLCSCSRRICRSLRRSASSIRLRSIACRIARASCSPSIVPLTR
jgi:hypothetical protein